MSSALYLEDAVSDVTLEARTIRKDNKPSTQYFLAYQKGKSNLTINIGDIDKLHEENFCVLLTEPSYYKGVVQGAPGALVGIPEVTADAFDELRAKIREGCLKHQVLGAMTHEVLFDLNAPQSMVDTIVRRKEEGSGAAVSMKFPTDAKYYKVRTNEDGQYELVLLKTPEQIAEFMRPGARFIANVSFASMYNQKACGCSRYIRWAAFLEPTSSMSMEQEGTICLGSMTTSVEVKDSDPGSPEKTDHGLSEPVELMDDYEQTHVFEGDELGEAFTSGEKRGWSATEDIDDTAGEELANKRSRPSE